MITHCDCKNEFQDARYGAGMRVHNWAPKVLSGAGGYRCTVCQKIKAGPKPATEVTKAKN